MSSVTVSRLETSGLDYRLAMKHRERAGDHHRAADQVPAGASEEKAAQVLNHLKALQCMARQRHFRDLAFNYRAPVEHAHQPAARHNLNAGAEHWAHQPEKGVAFQNAVGVQRAEIVCAAVVQARVERVRLASSRFADYEQVGEIGTGMKAENRPRGQLRS